MRFDKPLQAIVKDFVGPGVGEPVLHDHSAIEYLPVCMDVEKYIYKIEDKDEVKSAGFYPRNRVCVLAIAMRRSERESEVLQELSLRWR